LYLLPDEAAGVHGDHVVLDRAVAPASPIFRFVDRSRAKSRTPVVQAAGWAAREGPAHGQCRACRGAAGTLLRDGLGSSEIIAAPAHGLDDTQSSAPASISRPPFPWRPSVSGARVKCRGESLAKLMNLRPRGGIDPFIRLMRTADGVERVGAHGPGLKTNRALSLIVRGDSGASCDRPRNGPRRGGSGRTCRRVDAGEWTGLDPGDLAHRARRVSHRRRCDAHAGVIAGVGQCRGERGGSARMRGCAAAAGGCRNANPGAQRGGEVGCSDQPRGLLKPNRLLCCRLAVRA
jgi:hypothetical protein